ncbi:undecaprenyl-phosphate glucose phosphotransferase [Caballeronia sp. LZ029]|uniref:undecaprenyl-phosphate glucose phosphotransferase n=1 Tax=Caballeronia sp. LZ029 TaxID=3038564 RepID=UPI0028629624|nr:undecaprenyl-phosphate glucose phosphotransferase [Caballeronia sp. LZ029]MDR5744234.1 undecaprenyl-phosphate glucose phosphotransferase [Caballeronia sp. LZ029]
MRLPSYSHLLALPAGPDLLLRLLETIVVAASAFTAQRIFGHSVTAGYDSAVAAFAIIFAWSARSGFYVKNPARRASLPRAVLLPALGWVLCEIGAVCMIKWTLGDYQPSRAWLAGLFLPTAIGVMLCRVVDRIAGAWRVRRVSVAVVGRGARCAAFVRRIADMPDSACRVEALLDMDADADADAKVGGVALFHDIDTFVARVRAQRVDEVWLALPLTDEATLLRFLDVFRDDLLNIRFVPEIGQLTRFRSEADGLDATFAINLVAAPLTARALASKAIFDRIFSFCVVVGMSLVFVAIALAVKLSSPGPVLFRQRRHGANGTPFDIYKFRTMHTHPTDDGLVVQATRDDPRITRVGAFLRRTSLDELPQFFNVLRGEMSVVGPRPHAIEHDALYQHVVDGYIHRYRIKPGITGWAQINGLRGETDSVQKMQRRVEHDLYYLSNWSFALDMRIVLATIARGFVHRNAY